MYNSHLIAQKQDRGMLLVSHQGELQLGDEHCFMPTEALFSEYSFSLMVAENATTVFPSQIAADIDGRNIVLHFPKLRMCARSWW